MSIPLNKKKILITRPREQSREFITLVNQAGGDVLSFPTIRISGPDDWGECDKSIGELREYAWLVFTSLHSVEFFLGRCRHLNCWPERNRIAVIGEKTAQKVQEAGLDIDLMPTDYTARGLLDAFALRNIGGEKVLLPVSNLARHELSDGLKTMGALVDRVVTYKNTKPQDSDVHELQARLPEMDCLVFYSPSALSNFIEMVGQEGIDRLVYENVPVAIIGPTTAQAASDAGFGNIVQAPNSKTGDMVQAITEWFQQAKDGV